MGGSEPWQSAGRQDTVGLHGRSFGLIWGVLLSITWADFARRCCLVEPQKPLIEGNH